MFLWVCQACKARPEIDIRLAVGQYEFSIVPRSMFLPDFMSSLASGFVTVDLKSNTSLSIGRRWGSTSVHPCRLCWAETWEGSVCHRVFVQQNPPSYTIESGWMWIDLHTRNGSASPLEEDCNGSVARPWIVAYSISRPAPQGLRLLLLSWVTVVVVSGLPQFAHPLAWRCSSYI